MKGVEMKGVEMRLLILSLIVVMGLLVSPLQAAFLEPVAITGVSPTAGYGVENLNNDPSLTHSGKLANVQEWNANGELGFT